MQRPSRAGRGWTGNSGSFVLKDRRSSRKSHGLVKLSVAAWVYFFVLMIAMSVLIIGWNAQLSQEKHGVTHGSSKSQDGSQRDGLRKIEEVERESKRDDDLQKVKPENSVEGERVEASNREGAPSYHEPAPAPEFDRDGKTKLHLVFSTDCSGYQHWQSYLLFHSALMVRQPGHVTRIASGCDEEQAKEAQQWHDTHVKSTMSDRFGLHLTPKFDSVKSEKGETTGKNYKYFNKPFGLLHWLEHGEGMGVDPATGKLLDEDIIVILTDPDMILLHPIGADLNSKDDILAFPPENLQTFRVEHGKPTAQRFGYYNAWLNLNMTRIAGKDSPVHNLSRKDAFQYYPAGPPYVATGRDMYTIGKKWSEFVPESHADHPYLMAEMYAYSIAAAHLRLPHQLVDSHMVSDPGPVPMEGYPLINDIPAEDVCEVVEAHTQGRDTSHRMPSTIHYCQRYMVGNHFFGKRKQPHDFFSCSHPLMEVPPRDIAYKYDWRTEPGKKERKQITKSEAHNNAFMICGIISALNEAAVFFKRHHCSDSDGETRWDKSLDLADL